MTDVPSAAERFDQTSLVKISETDNHQQTPTENQRLSPLFSVQDCWFVVDTTGTKQAQRIDTQFAGGIFRQ